MRKKRILACSESSLSATGFGTYYHEILKRLHATDKYEICELASYQFPEETDRIATVPWKMIPVVPYRGNQQERQRYDSDPLNQFGQWKFEDTCLRFKPDIVFDVRDPWMFEYQQRSPFRRFFHWAIMPTVDSIPQEEQWLATYMDADAVFTYSDWARDVLLRDGNGKIKFVSPAPPAADMDVFKPVQDKGAHKLEMGIASDSFIIGTVMRNQRRKLYPNLIEDFKAMLTRMSPDIAQKSFLYLHTRWPDIGWDIPRLIKEAGISHKVIMTYICKNCDSAFPSLFQGARSYCRKCEERSAFLCDSDKGVSREVLAKVMNIFDAYVQYSYCEGFGMPLVEAAACGVPVAAVDYSAMEDVVRKLNGHPISVASWIREPETHRKMAIPSGMSFINRMIELANLPESVRISLGKKARAGAKKSYSYDETAKVWENHFDSVDLSKKQPWDSPANFFNPNFNAPDCSNEQLVRWGMCNVAGRPDLVNSYLALRMIRDLDNGCKAPHTGGMYFNELSFLAVQHKTEPFSQERALDEMLNISQNYNAWESKRKTGK